MPQLLHLVFGGELVDPQRTEFRDVDEIDIVGDLPELCHGLCRLEGQGAVDGRQCPHARYFIAHLHRLHDEEQPGGPTEQLG